jgi:hypothetical protein
MRSIRRKILRPPASNASQEEQPLQQASASSLLRIPRNPRAPEGGDMIYCLCSVYVRAIPAAIASRSQALQLPVETN